MACSSWLSQSAFLYNPGPPAMYYTTHKGLGLPTLITNQEIALQICPQANHMEAFSQLSFPLPRYVSRLSQFDIKLTQDRVSSVRSTHPWNIPDDLIQKFFSIIQCLSAGVVPFSLVLRKFKFNEALAVYFGGIFHPFLFVGQQVSQLQARAERC